MEELENLKYPIGKFKKPLTIDKNQISNWISDLENFSKQIKLVTNNISSTELNWAYRFNGWTVKQIIHHCADAHINAFIRMKLALTQVVPVINPFNEESWANLIDGNTDDISGSIAIIEGLHKRWVLLLQNLSSTDLKRDYFHPGTNEKVSIETAIAMYAWHCNHHLAHINLAILNKGNFKKVQL